MISDTCQRCTKRERCADALYYLDDDVAVCLCFRPEPVEVHLCPTCAQRDRCGEHADPVTICASYRKQTVVG